jgi:hypothetical protein
MLEGYVVSGSLYQNLSEFLGAILSVIGQVVLGFAGSSLALRGDSVTALIWAITERPKGAIMTNAAIVWIATDINVKEVTHIAGENNEKCDRLSRRGASLRTSISEDATDMGMPGARVVEMNGDEAIMRIVELYDPRIELDSEYRFIDSEFWVAIEKFMAVHGPAQKGGASP